MHVRLIMEDVSTSDQAEHHIVHPASADREQWPFVVALDVNPPSQLCDQGRISPAVNRTESYIRSALDALCLQMVGPQSTRVDLYHQYVQASGAMAQSRSL